MLDSIYHMTTTLKSHFWRKDVIILSLCTQRCYGRHNISRKLISILLHGKPRFRSARSFLGLETSISTRHTYKILIVFDQLVTFYLFSQTPNPLRLDLRGTSGLWDIGEIMKSHLATVEISISPSVG